ncbi:MAG: prolipoprotein diacylglyceryl transferase [Verrucomicrobiales bacterium]|nr:prolipoprotein diacylglyceryl transferase [Verrucomicrobiales bacterium]
MFISLATYVHHLDPFVIQFTETFGIRWYGLAYVAGFFCAFLLIRWFVKLGASELKEELVGDFVTVVALLGTMLGGRLGYMLLYNFGELAANPLSFFDFLGGGMSSHGGIAGMCIVAWCYSRYQKISWLGLGDNLVVVAPLGVFFGRLANFVNGELYGRTTSHSWAMKFPDELNELVDAPGGGRDWAFPTAMLRDLAEKGQGAIPGLVEKFDHAVSAATASGYNAHFAAVELITEVSRENETFRALLGEILTPRHPSQLYEAVVEGLLPFVILLAIRLKWKNLFHGMLTGIFFIVYAVGRIIVENFREPDAESIMGLTRGQFYSTFMIGIGIAFLAFALWKKQRTRVG